MSLGTAWYCWAEQVLSTMTHAHISSNMGNICSSKQDPLWGVPHLSTGTVHLLLTRQQGDAQTKACASVQHY